MTRSRDDNGEMRIRIDIDDATAEAVLTGAPVPSELAALDATIEVLRAIPEQPVRPSPELAARMATGDFSSAAAQRASRRSAGRHARRRLAAVPLRVRVAAGAALAVGGLATATAAGALPDPAQQRVQSVIESVTPFEFPQPADFGRDVADDATDGGVDGTEVSENTRDLGVRPGHSGDGPGAGTSSGTGSESDRGADPPGQGSGSQRPDDVGRTVLPPPAVDNRPDPPPPGVGSGGPPADVTPGPPQDRPGNAPPRDPGSHPGEPDPPGPPEERPVQPRPTD